MVDVVRVTSHECNPSSRILNTLERDNVAGIKAREEEIIRLMA